MTRALNNERIRFIFGVCWLRMNAVVRGEGGGDGGGGGGGTESISTKQFCSLKLQKNVLKEGGKQCGVANINIQLRFYICQWMCAEYFTVTHLD